MAYTLEKTKVTFAQLIGGSQEAVPVKFTSRSKKIGALLVAAVVFHGPLTTSVETGAGLVRDIASSAWHGVPKPEQPTDHSNSESGGAPLDQDPSAVGAGAPVEVQQLQQNQAVNTSESQH